MAARELGWTFYENDFHTLTDEECPYIGNQYFFRPFSRGVRAQPHEVQSRRADAARVARLIHNSSAPYGSLEEAWKRLAARGGQSVHKTQEGFYVIYHHHTLTTPYHIRNGLTTYTKAFAHDSATGWTRFYRHDDGSVLFAKDNGAWRPHFERRDMGKTFMDHLLRVFAPWTDEDSESLDAVLEKTVTYIDKLYQPVEAAWERQEEPLARQKARDDERRRVERLVHLTAKAAVDNVVAAIAAERAAERHAKRLARQAAKKAEAERQRIEALVRRIAKLAVQNVVNTVAAQRAAERGAQAARERAAELEAKRAADAAHAAMLARLRQLNRGINRRPKPQ